MDPPILGEVKGWSFGKYMRLSLANGGFAGFAKQRDRPKALLAMLIEGCPALYLET